MDFFETYGAGFAALLGGVGVKIIDKMLSKRSEPTSDTVNALREELAELRRDLDAAREDIDKFRAEADEWRTKYWNKVAETLHPTNVPSGSNSITR